MTFRAVPDWRDASNYGDVTLWSPSRWDWEAIRRRSDYRADALEIRELLTVPILTRKADRTLTARWNAFHKRWGFSKALDPCVADHPEFDLLRSGFSDTSNALRYMPGCKNSENYNSGVSPNIGELAVVFDLHAPIEDQLKQARAVLKKERIAANITQSRYRNDLDYLRALDAEAQGAFNSPLEVARALWPCLEKTAQSAKDTLNAAHKWQARF